MTQQTTQADREGQEMSYVYIKSEQFLWTVGFYDPDGKWRPASDHDTEKAAQTMTAWLNGAGDHLHYEHLHYDADTLARIREKNLLRSEVPEAPEWATKWVLEYRECNPFTDSVRRLTYWLGDDGTYCQAPDYRPEHRSESRDKITLAIVED